MKSVCRGLGQRLESLGKRSSARRIAFGMSAHLYGQVVTMAVQLISVPVLIHAWGLEYYGLWLTLTAIPAYLALTDFGLAQVTASTLTMQVASGDRDGALATFASALVMFLGLVGVVGFLGTVFVTLAPLEVWFATNHGEPIRWVVLLVGAQVLISVMSGLLSAAMRSVGRYPLVMTMSATARLGSGIGLLASAALGGGMIHAAAVMLAVQIAFSLLSLYLLTRVAPWIRLDLKRVSVRDIQVSVGPSLSFGAYTLGNMLSLQGLVIVIAATLGPVAVACISITRTLCRMGVTAGNMISNTLQVEYSMLFGQQELQGLTKMLRTHLLAASLLSLAYFAAMAAIGPWVIDVLTHGEVLVPRFLLWAMAGGCVLEILWMALLTPLVSINRHQRAGMLYLGVSVLGLAFVGAGSAMGVAIAGWHSLAVGSLMVIVCASSFYAQASTLGFAHHGGGRP